MDGMATTTPGAFLRASPEGVKHMDVLNTKNGRAFYGICPRNAAAIALCRDE
jgi:hypothetical protein